MSEVNLTRPRFKVGDRVVHVNAVRGDVGVVTASATARSGGNWVCADWPKGWRCYLEASLEPAERWQTDAERDGL